MNHPISELNSVEKSEILNNKILTVWTNILPKFLDLCLSSCSDHRPGLSIFKMLTKEEQKHSYVTSTIDTDQPQRSNCSYWYFDRSQNQDWGLLEYSPMKDKILQTYDPHDHIIVILAISEDINNIEAEYINSIKLFQKELSDGKMVEILY